MSKYLSFEVDNLGGMRTLVLAENIAHIELYTGGGLPYVYIYLRYNTSLINSGGTASQMIRLELSGTGVRATDNNIYTILSDLIASANDNVTSVYEVPKYLKGVRDASNHPLSIKTISVV